VRKLRVRISGNNIIITLDSVNGRNIFVKLILGKTRLFHQLAHRKEGRLNMGVDEVTNTAPHKTESRVCITGIVNMNTALGLHFKDGLKRIDEGLPKAHTLGAVEGV